MNPLTTSAFDLPDQLAAKADPALIAGDEQHFAADRATASSSRSPTCPTGSDAERQAPGGTGQAALDRDLEVHRLTAAAAHAAPLRPGPVPGAHRPRRRPRAGVRRTARPHRQRPAAGCWSTGARPRPSRSSGRPTPTRWGWRAGAATAGPAAGSATTGTRCSPPTGSTGTPRSTTSPRSSPAWAAAGRPGCATCSAPSRPTRTRSSARGPRGALVVDGGPGTGKTVVALHRTAYLLYADPRLGHRRGGVLFVGPHQPYLAYVADVLPSLGEEGVQTCTLRDLVPEGAAAGAEADPRGGPAEGVRRRWCGRSSRPSGSTRSRPPRA